MLFGPLGVVCVSAPRLAWAIDEIQVYNAEIAEPGQWTVEQHLNYVGNGLQQPDHPGGLISNHSFNGTPEFAYGVTPWWEVGFYAPFALEQHGPFFAQGVKLRTLFVSPDAEKRDFFYGANFEFSYNSAVFSPVRFGVELRPIVGVRNQDLEFIVNPIVDFAAGRYGSTNLRRPSGSRTSSTRISRSVSNITATTARSAKPSR